MISAINRAYQRIYPISILFTIYDRFHATGKEFVMNAGKQPDVSIIVPVYNVEKYVRRCLDSLVNQDCSCNYEIIIINDGSQDGSSDIINEFEQSYDFIRAITQENSGLSAARNRGITEAKGKYVALVDSDDFVEPGYISAMYELAEKHNADIVQCRYRNYFEKSQSSMNILFSHRKGVADGEKALGNLITDVTVRSYAWNKLYKRSIFVDNGIKYPDRRLFEDLMTTPKLFSHAKKVAFTRDVLYNYSHRSDSITGCAGRKMVEGYRDAVVSLSEYVDNSGLYHRYKTRFGILTVKAIITLYGMIARQYLAGKGDGGSFIGDCLEVRRTVKASRPGRKQLYARARRKPKGKIEC